MDKGGEGWTRVDMDRGNRGVRILKSESTWTDGDGVLQVKRDGGVKGLAEAGHASTSMGSRGVQVVMDGLSGLGLKTTM